MIKSLEDFQIYQMAMKLGEDVWSIVVKWDYFCKDTIGKQLVRAVEKGRQSDLATWRFGDLAIWRKNL